MARDIGSAVAGLDGGRRHRRHLQPADRVAARPRAGAVLHPQSVRSRRLAPVGQPRALAERAHRPAPQPGDPPFAASGCVGGTHRDRARRQLRHPAPANRRGAQVPAGVDPVARLPPPGVPQGAGLGPPDVAQWLSRAIRAAARGRGGDVLRIGRPRLRAHAQSVPARLFHHRQRHRRPRQRIRGRRPHRRSVGADRVAQDQSAAARPGDRACHAGDLLRGPRRFRHGGDDRPHHQFRLADLRHLHGGKRFSSELRARRQPIPGAAGNDGGGRRR